MFRTKKDVERHVSDVLSKIDNENEKNLRGYTFARLFFQVKDYESAKKYLTGFLSVRDHHAASHKLMAQIYDATSNPENALQSYKRSLEIDPHQNDIVLKICELYCQLPVDHETARYWADRAEQLFPHHETVFKLREYLVSAEGEPDRQELERLIATELHAQPKNIDLRIKLLRLYLDSERVKEAYDHATMVESKRLFPHSVDWYYLLGDIFEAYQEECNQDLDSQFYINYLTALDHLIFLTLTEPHTFILENGKKSPSLNDAAAVLLTFDQLLKTAVKTDIKEGSWNYFIHHMKGQLYFYMTSLLMKRVKMDQGNRKEAFKFSSGLAAVCYTFKPINLWQEVWFSQMEDNQKAFTNFFQQASLRTSFIGHVLLTLCKDDKSSWLQKLKIEVCIPQVKERIYNRLFTSLFQKEKLSLSYFISDSTFEKSSLELPTEVVLSEYDTSAYKLCPNSLHHLVWLELHREKFSNSTEDNITEIFKTLQYSNKNLSYLKGSCESLCVLDLEAFLFATVYQSKLMIEKRNNVLSSRNDSVLSYPPDIADALCTKAQAAWWKAAHGLYSCAIKEKLGEHRRCLQHGLEVIRGTGNHGMDIQLVIHLAKSFSSKADALSKRCESKTGKNKNKLTSESVAALYARATHYWNIALHMLEKLSSGHTLNIPKDPMFNGSSKALSKSDINTYQEEGQLFLAVRLMDSDKLNEAAEILCKLVSPYGSYYLSLTLKKLASQEQRYSNTRVALLTKSKNSLLETMDRIKDDKIHPLNREIFIELEDVENDLAQELSNANENSCEDLDETDTYDGSSINNSSYSFQEKDKSAIHSTPRPSAKFMSSKRPVRPTIPESPSQHFEPSPERLDAQIRALTLNQDSLLKSFLQQQETLLETNKSIVDALKQNKEVVEQLKKQLEELTLTEIKCHPKNVPKKSGVIKVHRDEDEDYYDPSTILDYYEDGGDEYRVASGYSFDRSSRIVHEQGVGASAPPLNYVVSSALPPGPPPALNHYGYQYPPHAVLPAAAVPERPPYYAPGQGLPFSEGQRLPQFHFHVASSVVKPPTLTTSLPPVVPGLPPPPVNVPPPAVVMPPPSAPLPASNPWSKAVSVPHAFQIPLPTSTIFVSAASTVVPTQIVPSSLPAATTSQSQLKDLLQTPVTKTINFGQPLTTASPAALNASPSIFSGLAKTPDTFKNQSRCDSENAASPDIDGHDLEREVMGDFKPLIPLPAEIVVETGEEDEIVLFEDRAKLYRFVDQEWKERGIGYVKILHDEVNGRARLLMRRDQVLKVCANHYITSNMEMHAMKNSDKAWTWFAQDFADEKLNPEHFCIRFKTPEVAAVFRTAFAKAVNISKEAEARKVASPKLTTTVTTSPLSQKPFGGKFLPKAGSWTCPTCYVSNPADKLQCIACDTHKPGSHTSMATSITSPATTITPLNSDNKSPFQVPAISSTFTFGFPTTGKTALTSTDGTKNVFGGFTFISNPVIQDAETSEIKDREILVVSTKSKDGPQVTKLNSPKTSPFTGFSFKSPTATSASSQPPVSKSSPFTEFSFTPSPTSTAQSSTKVTSLKNISISTIQSSMQNISPTFVFAKSSAGKDVSSTNASGSLFIHVSADGRRVSTDGTDGAPEEFEPTVEFKPVVSLPALVDLKTGEEDEEKLFGERAKLFRFDPETKEWKERGTGEIKILYLKDSHKYRILMRREQVLKICANHYILPEIELTPLNNSDKAWMWVAQDYSDGEVSQVQLAVRFKSSDIAKNFSSVFKNCQKELSMCNNLNKSNNSVNPCAGNKNAFGSMFQHAANSWNCSKCSKSNMNCTSCVYCQTLHPDSGKLASVLSTHQKSAENLTPETWVCQSCRSKNNLSSSICISCSFKPITNNSATSISNLKTVPGSTNVAKADKPLSELFKPQADSWGCQACLVPNNVESVSCVCCNAPKPGLAPSSNTTSNIIQNFSLGNSLFSDKADKPLSELFKPQAGSWECQACLVRNDADSVKCVSCETLKPGAILTNTTSSTFGFGISKSGDFVFGVKPTTQSTTFTFGLSDLSEKPIDTVGFKPSFSADSSIPAVFGGTTQKAESATAIFEGTTPKAESAASIFGGTAPKAESAASIFGGTAKKTESAASIFGGTAQKAESAASIFGGTAHKAESAASIFGGTVQKAESAASIFGGAAQKSETFQNASLFGESVQKSDSPKTIFGGSIQKSESTPIFKSSTETSVTSKPFWQKSETTQSVTTTTLSTSQSVFSFGSSTADKDESGPEFRFGSPQKYEFNFSGIRPRSPAKTPKSPRSPATPSDVEDDEENESFDADNIYFQPVIPLPPKVDVKTGEENEKTVFSKRAKLFRFCSGEWKERGIGDIKILHDEVNKKVRLLMRRDQVLKVCLNHYLSKDICFEKRGDKTLSWAATDFSENEPSDEIFALRFKTSEYVDEFKASIDSVLKLIDKPSSNVDIVKAASLFSFKSIEAPFGTGSLTSMFGTSGSVFGSATNTSFPFLKDAPPTGTFFSQAACGDNRVKFEQASETTETGQANDDEIQVIYEAKVSPEDEALAKELLLPPSFFLYKNKPDCPGCIGCENYVPPHKTITDENTQSSTEVKNVVPESAASEGVDTMFNVKDAISFADLATSTEFKYSSNSKAVFEGAGTPLFANLNTSTEADGEEDTVAQGPDIHFEPVVPLPELVAVKTGEEDETAIFVNRAKLFKYDTAKKEWKERGIGDLKILKHNEKLRFRLILRRDQVHKIACNHCIEEKMELSPLATSAMALCWNALDYSEGQPEAAQFAVRFKTKEMLEQFKVKFNECRELLKKGASEASVEVDSTSIVNQNDVAKSSPAKEVVELSDSNTEASASQNEHESSESENEDEEDSDDESTVFEKRVVFEISEGSEKDFAPFGIGVLKIDYDDTVFGYHVYMTADNGVCLCDHIIAIQTVLSTEKKKATWAAIDLSVDPPRRRKFRATFATVDALREFNDFFEEGKEAAVNSEIMEKTEYNCFSPSGQQT